MRILSTEAAEFCRRIVGLHTLTPTQPPAGAVTCLRDQHGRTWILKIHNDRTKHLREVHAYTHWTAALGDRTACLIASDPAIPAVLLTALSGRPPQPADDPHTQQHAHRQAGALLRRLHQAQPPSPLPDHPARLASLLESWLTRGHELFSTTEQTLARRHIAALADLPAVPGVPCHLDYQPANWLTDATGTLRILDFEHARIDTPARDLVRLTYRHWTRRPDLREAFLAGYGRALTDTEQQAVQHCAALDAVTAVVRGHQRGNAELTALGRNTFHQLQAVP